MSNTIQAQLKRHTELGPFQKYLFSGACYVRVGQCYALVRHSLNHGGLAGQNEEIAESLNSIWNEFLATQQAAFAASFPDQEEGPELASQLMEFDQEIRKSGALATSRFLESVAQVPANDMELKVFFQQWAESCEVAYRELVLSESCSRLLGTLVSTTISATISDHPDQRGE